MPVSPAREKWGLCRSCGEIVRLSPDPSAGKSYHSPTCPERVPRDSHAAPAEQPAPTAHYASAESYAAAEPYAPEEQPALAEQPAPTEHYAPAEQYAPDEQYAPASGNGRQAAEEEPGTSFGDARGRSRRSAAALLPHGQSKKTLLSLAIAAAGGILTVTLLASGALAGKTQPPAASAPHVGHRTSVHTPAFASPSPATPSASPHAGSAPSPAVIHHATPLPTQTPASNSPQPQLLVHDDFTGGSTDGWVQEWGNITLTPSTQPAIDGGSLVLTTSGNSNVAVGTSVNGATQLTTGDTVTYHVWSSGQLAGVQPFVADDNNGIHESSVVVLPTTSGWITVTWTIPSTPSIEGIGLEVNNPNPGSGLTVALGGVSWPQQ